MNAVSKCAQALVDELGFPQALPLGLCLPHPLTARKVHQPQLGAPHIPCDSNRILTYTILYISLYIHCMLLFLRQGICTQPLPIHQSDLLRVVVSQPLQGCVQTPCVKLAIWRLLHISVASQPCSVPGVKLKGCLPQLTAPATATQLSTTTLALTLSCDINNSS